MNIEINGVNLKISATVKAIVNNNLAKKLDQLLVRFEKEFKVGFLHLEKDKYKHFKAKFDISLPGQDGHLFAKSEHIDLISAIVDIREQLEKQIKKYKQDKVNYSLG
jgi:ribosomal subunit interface protein